MFPPPGRRLRLRIARRSRHVWLSRSLWNRRVVFIVGSVAAALAAVGFALAATWTLEVLGRLLRAFPWAAFVLAPLGLALVSWLSRRYFRGAEGSGIPQTIAALGHPDAGLRARLLSLRIAFGKIGLTLLGLLSGASIGREGPTVQVAASIMYSLDRFSPFPHESMKRGLILAGGAAGIAAAFNAPLAGVVFAIEEMSRSFSQRTSGIVITAVIIAGIVSYGLLGNYAYFGRTAATLDFASGWKAVVLCGTLGGLFGGAFSRTLIAASRSVEGPFARFRRTRPVVFAALCGLAIAILGYASEGTIYGTGYAETKRVLQEGGGVPLTFGILKLLATVVSYVTGIPGGIFSPSLAIGAGLGQDIAALLAPAPVGAVAVIGMVAYFSGVVQAPITAFVIVAEMTRDADMALPLMAASIIAYGFSRLICPQPVYKALSKAFRPSRAATPPLAS
ncbi:MAG TPA: chloride channel protein [Usitatibacter sp.]|jgi:H+/Cl- antiporter ClcA|nr:chloride channel protein [Usitatibacter sp.]